MGICMVVDDGAFPWTPYQYQEIGIPITLIDEVPRIRARQVCEGVLVPLLLIRLVLLHDMDEIRHLDILAVDSGIWTQRIADGFYKDLEVVEDGLLDNHCEGLRLILDWGYLKRDGLQASFVLRRIGVDLDGKERTGGLIYEQDERLIWAFELSASYQQRVAARVKTVSRYAIGCSVPSSVCT